MDGMGILMRILSIAVLLLATGIACLAEMAPLTVLFTNDLHARLGVLPALSDAIAQERQWGGPVLLLDAGDAWHDFRRPIYSVWADARMVEWMNEVSYSAMALGNHDAYHGEVRLRRRVEMARFPVLCANWRPMKAGHPILPSVVMPAGKLQVLLVGVITDEFLPFPAYPAFEYRCPEDAIREEIERHAGRFDLVIVVGHVGVVEAQQIARAVPEIALFLTGHSHDELAEPILEGATIIAQTGAFGRRLGRLVLEVAPGTGRATVVSHELLPMQQTPADIGAGIRRLVMVVSAIILGTIAWLI